RRLDGADLVGELARRELAQALGFGVERLGHYRLNGSVNAAPRGPAAPGCAGRRSAPRAARDWRCRSPSPRPPGIAGSARGSTRAADSAELILAVRKRWLRRSAGS